MKALCMNELSPLPPTAQEIADVIGRAATLAIAARATHRCVYVPKHEAPDHWIAQLIGAELFSKMQHVFAGEQLPLAKCSEIARHERNASVCAMYRDGRTINEIARELDCTPRFIAMVLRGQTDGRPWSRNAVECASSPRVVKNSHRGGGDRFFRGSEGAGSQTGTDSV